MRVAAILLTILCAAASVSAGPSPQTISLAPLATTSATTQTLVRAVEPSVVQVLVTGYQPSSDGSTGPVLIHSRAIGSGVAIAAGGYIVTNAHVVSGAERIDIVPGDAEDAPLARHGGHGVAARLVGVAPELDLALLQADVNLPPLPLADPGSVHQGDLVFAFGSPEGLRNSVSMGLVSAVARQVEPDSPIAYVQTDSAINPGNSGGPLVNVRGELVGLNTFIHSQSGGSEGLGFALPAAIVSLAVPVLRQYGHLHHAALGVAMQDVTPALREGLSLSDDATVIVADVVQGGPAATAGLRPGDVIVSLDGRPVPSLSYVDLYRYLYALTDGTQVTVGYRRGEQVVEARVRAAVRAHLCGAPSTLEHMEDDLVEPLGVIVSGVDGDDHTGVIVNARVATPASSGVPLAIGDLIHAINGVPVTSAAALRDAMGRIPHGHGVVLQVERDGGLTFVSFER